MSTEEAISICKAIKKNIKCDSTFDLNILKLNRNNEEAIETILQALENSIPREVVEKKIEKMDKIIQENKIGHKHTVIEASIVKSELQELLEGK